MSIGPPPGETFKAKFVGGAGNDVIFNIDEHDAPDVKTYLQPGVEYLVKVTPVPPPEAPSAS